jgi:hypothetical protein
MHGRERERESGAEDEEERHIHKHSASPQPGNLLLPASLSKDQQIIRSFLGPRPLDCSAQSEAEQTPGQKDTL